MVASESRFMIILVFVVVRRISIIKQPLMPLNLLGAPDYYVSVRRRLDEMVF